MIDTSALREKVLDLAIRGKLVSQDPNDEPASVLLERVRTEKEQMVKDGKLKAKDIKNNNESDHYNDLKDGAYGTAIIVKAVDKNGNYYAEPLVNIGVKL